MSEAQEITLALNGRWHGSYGLAFCPVHKNTRTPALSLSNGADSRLLAYCHSGCDFTDVLDALKAKGLVEGVGKYSPPDPAEYLHRQAQEKADRERRNRLTRKLWTEARPIAGTIGETYLRGRAITCALPKTLRFHPACWHSSGQHVPAMVGLIEGAKGFALHRTYLQLDGFTKASVTPAKAMLGQTRGGAVRLSNGAGPLVIAEGVETGLSLLSGILDGALNTQMQVWAALSSSGMQSLHLPANPDRLTIAIDSDDNGAGHKSATKLAQRADALGWKVSLFPAPKGFDWNDVLKGGNA